MTKSCWLRFSILFFCFLCSQNLIAQQSFNEITILLKPSKTDGDTIFRRLYTLVGNARNLSSVPESINSSAQQLDLKYVTKKSRIMVAQLGKIDQVTYERYKRHILDSAAFEKVRKNFNIDTNLVSKKPINDILFIYSAKLADGKNLFVIDADMNKSFTGDSAYMSEGFNDSDTLQEKKIQKYFTDIKVNNAEYYSNKLYKSSFYFDIKLDETFSANKVDSTSLSYRVKNIKEGILNLPGKSIPVYVRPIGFEKLTYDRSDIRLSGSGDKTVHAIGDTIYIDKDRYLIKKINLTGDSLVIGKLANNSPLQFGSETGQLAQDFELPDTHNKIFALANNTGAKYLVLDFWGTWCHPCLENLPRLKEFYNRIKKNDSVEIIGICVDDLSNKKELLNKIDKLNIPWRNLLLDRNVSFSSANTIVNLYKISAFPTYMLIGPDRTIIARDIGEEGLQTVLDKVPAFLNK